MKILILLLSMASLSIAETLSSVSAPYDYQSAPEYQAILAVLKSYGKFIQKDATDNLRDNKNMSRGERLVEEAKAKNRARLAEMRKSEERTPKEEGLAAWKKEVRSAHDSWKKEVDESRKQWKREQDIFLGRIKIYKEATFEVPVKEETIIEKKIPLDSLPDVIVVNSAFSIPIRDQLGRATCSAFSGIRAIEILLAQNKKEKDLSEQYFYWSSKPDCHKGSCKKRGSWVTPGFQYSQNRPEFDIPLETSCEYQSAVDPTNETHAPLLVSCKSGEVKVVSYEEVKTLADTIQMFKRNIPVIMAAKLTENFYANNGLVTVADSRPSGANLDEHALGHAFLGIGMMELPKTIHESEGEYCILVANSWGKGWGAGGYSCLSQKWLEKNRQQGAFAVVTRVNLK